MSTNLYIGTRQAACAEPSAYVTQTVGGGTYGTNVGSDLLIGNAGAGSLAFPGYVAQFGYVASVLSISQLHQIQFSQKVPTATVWRGELGYPSSSVVADWSGNGNAGAVSGAAVTSHAPLNNPFWQPSAWSIPAVGISIPVLPDRMLTGGFHGLTGGLN